MDIPDHFTRPDHRKVLEDEIDRIDHHIEQAMAHKAELEAGIKRLALLREATAVLVANLPDPAQAEFDFSDPPEN